MSDAAEDILTILVLVILSIHVVKCIWLGGGFNLRYWFKYGKRYMKWYKNQPKFKR